jgi:hypothetical protein
MDGTETMTGAIPGELGDRIDWAAAEDSLGRQGYAVLPRLVDRAQAQVLAGLWDEAGFRSHVIMARHGYGQGEYRYFARPLPPPVAALRAGLYPPLAAIANRWQVALGATLRFPPTLAGLERRCRAAGQVKPTPLLLDYGPGDFNCLHQDVYGEVFFPLQAAVLLSRPGEDFGGGEFVLVEQRPRQQSRPMVVALAEGDAVVFAGRERPRGGKRGVHRVVLRHGVSEITRGRRRTLGLIFHDAR